MLNDEWWLMFDECWVMSNQFCGGQCRLSSSPVRGKQHQVLLWQTACQVAPLNVDAWHNRQFWRKHMYTNVSTTRNIINYVHVLVKGRMHFRWGSDMCRGGIDLTVVPAGMHQICSFDFGSLRTLLQLPRAVLRLCQPPLGRISTIGDGCFEF